MLTSNIAGLDTPDFLAAINDMITNNGKGNPELTNLPRKLNIGLSPSRDDFPHTHINDVGLKAVHDPETGEVLSFLTVIRQYLQDSVTRKELLYQCGQILFSQHTQCLLFSPGRGRSSPSGILFKHDCTIP